MVFEAGEYQLLDFGEGRKLERFGAEVLDRPSPAADGQPTRRPELWEGATARFVAERGGKGQWEGMLRSASVDGSWTVRYGNSRLLLKLSASGNIGVFPEHASTWGWVANNVADCRNTRPDERPRVLNLFAYTGGATLAAALAGAEVTHVDSSGPTVAWAKRNAEASGAADLPIRWLVEDAMKFVAREVRRGSRYDGIIADPPTYGHGPKGKPFKFRQHLDALLEMCAELLDSGSVPGRFLLFSCHAPGFGVDDAVSAVSRVLAESRRNDVEGRPLVLGSADGPSLGAGVCATWSSGCLPG